MYAFDFFYFYIILQNNLKKPFLKKNCFFSISTFDKLDLQQEYIFINYNPT